MLTWLLSLIALLFWPFTHLTTLDFPFSLAHVPRKSSVGFLFNQNLQAAGYFQPQMGQKDEVHAPKVKYGCSNFSSINRRANISFDATITGR